MKTHRAATLALFLLVGCPAGGPPVEHASRGRTSGASVLSQRAMRVHFINVGQGDAILVEFPCAAMLVDTGAEKNDQYDGVEALSTYLRAFFARRQDLNHTLALLVITHPHIDHTRGVRAVVDGGYTISNVVTNGQSSGSGGRQQKWLIETWLPGHPDVKSRTVSTADLPPTAGLAGPIIDPIACREVNTRIRALWGRVSENPGWPDGDYETENNHSIVLRVDFGRSSALLTGDLQASAIGAVVARHAASGLLDVDLYKVGDHGSRNATTKELLDAMTPKMGVIMMGPSARQVSHTAWAYGHPRRHVVQMVAGAVSASRAPATVRVAEGVTSFGGLVVDKAVYGTGWDGNVVVEMTANGSMQVKTEQ